MPYNSREMAAFGAFVGALTVVLASYGLLSGTVPPDRRPVASWMIPSGLLVVAVAGWWLIRLKRAEPPQSWRWFLRRELFALGVGIGLVGFLAVLPEEQREGLEEAIAVVADNLQTLTAGLPP
jgi:hypothetical protein